MAETTVLLARHAEAETNLHPELVAGFSPESPLTSDGVWQGRWLGLYLKRMGFFPELVVSSSAKRTRQTGALALQVIGNGCQYQPIEVDDRLKEMSQGGWEGQPRAGRYETWMRRGIQAKGIDFAMIHPYGSGESRREVAARMREKLEEIRESGAERVFAISHRIAIVCLLAELDGWPDDAHSFDNFGNLTAPHANTTVSGLRSDGDGWRILFRARQPGELTRLDDAAKNTQN